MRKARHQSGRDRIADRYRDDGNGFRGPLRRLGSRRTKCGNDIYRHLRKRRGSGIQLIRIAIRAQRHVGEILTLYIIQFAQLLAEQIATR